MAGDGIQGGSRGGGVETLSWVVKMWWLGAEKCPCNVHV